MISFLNGILYDGEPIVRDLEILDPYQAPKIVGIKATYLDVRAHLNTGETVIIEMQVLNIAGFEKRVLYNAAKAYAVQLDAGKKYMTLNAVIAVTITDFEMFPTFSSVISRFVLKERNELIDYPIGDLELVFVELPKFTRSLAEIETLSDQWLFFLKNAPDLSIVPREMETIPEIQQAFEIAQQSNLTRGELEEIEKQGMYIQDQLGIVIKATEDGMTQGRKDAKIEIAQKLLNLLDNSTISATTGLSISEVQALRSL